MLILAMTLMTQDVSKGMSQQQHRSTAEVVFYDSSYYIRSRKHAETPLEELDLL